MPDNTPTEPIPRESSPFPEDQTVESAKLPRCPTCSTEMEVRGSRTFCPACMLKDLWNDNEPPTIDTGGPTPTRAPVSISPNAIPDVPRHRLVEKLGEGGFAIVYRAMQLEPVKREVAVKVLKPNMGVAHVMARFDIERQTLARMEHPGIARLWDAGQTTDGQPFFAMELVRGVPVTTFAHAHRLTLDDRLELFVKICRAVQHAHEKGVLHRDLKPSNLLVGEDREVKVIDFGIAKALEVDADDAPAYTTSIHQAVGTPGYMSPEQAEWGANVIDARSDIYALGVLLFEMMTGRTPLDVERKTNATARRRAVATAIVPPSQVDGSLLQTKTQRRDLDAIVLKALERDSTLRYSSAASLADDVERHLADKPVEAANQSMAYVLGKFARRHQGLVAATAVAAIAVIIGFTTSTTLYLREQRLTKELDRSLKQTAASEQRAVKALSRADFAAAQRFKEAKDYQSAVASLVRVLENDPSFSLAASDMQTLLAYGDFLQPLEPPVPIRREWGSIPRAAVSADGRTLAADFKTDDNVHHLMLWLRTGDSWQERQISTPTPVTHLAMAATGRLMVHVESSSEVVLTTLGDTPSPPRKWRSKTPVTSLSIITRAGRALVGCKDGSLLAVDAASNAEPELIFRLPHAITRLQCSEASSTIVAGCEEGEVYLWRVGDQGVRQIAKMPGPVNVIVQRDNPVHVVIGDHHGYVAHYSSESNSEVKPIKLHEGSVTALAQGGVSTVLSAGTDSKIRWHDFASDTDVQAPVETAGYVQSIFMSRGDLEATFITGDSSVRQWRRGEATPLTLRKPQRAHFGALSILGRCLVVQRDDGNALEVLSLADHASVPMRLHSGGSHLRTSQLPRMLAFGVGTPALLTTSGEGDVNSWDSTDAQLAFETRWPSPALAMQSQPSGNVLAALKNGALVESDMSGKIVKTLVEPELKNSVLPLPGGRMGHWDCAAISCDGKGVAWGETSAEPSQACEVRIQEAEGGKFHNFKTQRLACLALDAAHGRLVLGLHNGVVRVTDFDGKGKSYSWHLSRVTSLALSPDGKLLISGSSDGTVALWDTASGRPRSDYLRLERPVFGVAISGDGKRFAAATDEDYLVGDTTMGTLIGPRIPFVGFNGSIALNQDGTLVAVSGSDGSTIVSAVAPDLEPPPPWFTNTIYTFVSRRFTGQGVLWNTEHPGLGVIKQSLPPNASGPWNYLARWLLEHPGARTLNPWTSLTLPEYLQTVISRPGEVARAERMRHGPKVRSQMLEADPPATPTH